MSNADIAVKMIARISYLNEEENWRGLADFYEDVNMEAVLESLGALMKETKFTTFRLSVDKGIEVPRLNRYPGWAVEDMGNRYILTATSATTP